ncbi:MAG: 5-carboxymethyl-2-hydroxymuconate Delta-isomerase [Bacteroidetes bacterium]|nr:5-carboxymethyl-2-hydroxymuconate Delta-isomerase [Bacteroidota bacterium]
MPHIRLEYTSNLNIDSDINSLFFDIHHVLNQVTGIKIDNCKSRAVHLDTFYVGDGRTENTFVHLEVSLLEGRQDDLVQLTGKKLLDLLLQFFANGAETQPAQYTVEIRDMKRDRYFKQTSGSTST